MQMLPTGASSFDSHHMHVFAKSLTGSLPNKTCKISTSPTVLFHPVAAQRILFPFLCLLSQASFLHVKKHLFSTVKYPVKTLFPQSLLPSERLHDFFFLFCNMTAVKECISKMARDLHGVVVRLRRPPRPPQCPPRLPSSPSDAARCTSPQLAVAVLARPSNPHRRFQHHPTCRMQLHRNLL